MFNPFEEFSLVLQYIFDWMQDEYQVGPYSISFWQILVFGVVVSFVFWGVSKFLDND